MSTMLIRPKISKIDRSLINSMLKIMIANDNVILPESNIAPKIWFCDWYNAVDDKDKLNYNLYKEGDAVWINTENLDQFTKSNITVIKSKVLSNPVLRNLYENIKDDENKTFLFYKDIVVGKITGNKDRLPLFYIGDVLKNTLIRVSLSSDNDKPPTDNLYWTDFFVNNDKARFSNQIISRTKVLCQLFLERHIKDYHLSGVYSYWEELDGEKHLLSDFYLLLDMSNLNGTFDYVNINGYANKGIDYVLYFHLKKFSDNCWKWFRVWKSGMLEHGGIVNADDPLITLDELAYKDKNGKYTNYKVNLKWSDSASVAPGYTYPIDSTGFYYEDYSIDIGDKNKIPLEEIAKSISQLNRFSAYVTPILNMKDTEIILPYLSFNPEENKTNGIYYSSIDINSMTNTSFCFNLLKDVKFYSYNVKGYSINSQQLYKN